MKISLVKVHHIVWIIRKAPREFSYFEIALLILVFSSGIFYFVFLLPLVGRLNAFKMQLDDGSMMFTSQILPFRAPGSSQRLAEFRDFFVASSNEDVALARVFQAAAAQELNLDQGDYRLERDRYSKLQRYEIELPVKGTYPQLRHFLAKTLADVPSLALDSVSFNRQKIDDAALDARVKMTLYMREE